jgi:TRAP-type mannitol/chloroaromatic compound transport system substrate-binding protein
MKRRGFLLGAGAGAIGLSTPAIAQGPKYRWRLVSSFPKSLDTLFGAAEFFAERVKEATNGEIEISVYAAGEIVPALQAFDAVSDGTVELCHTCSYYFVGKDPAFTFGTTLPFGLNTRQHDSWLIEGGAQALLDKFYGKYGVKSFACGNVCAQMGGWFRKEIKSVEDLAGLKFRIGGLAGQVVQKLGVVPQQIPAGDLYPALERGTIDAAEWVGPYDDEKLGLHKVAPYYYYPGWWEGSATIHLFMQNAIWDELPAHYRALIEMASSEANAWMQARYNNNNPAALRRLVAEGAQLRAYPDEVFDAAFDAAHELFDEIAASNADFKELYDHLTAYRQQQYSWWQFAEHKYDDLMINALRKRR